MVEIWIHNLKPLDQGNPCYYYIKYFKFIRLRFGIQHDQIQVGLKYFVLFSRLICESKMILFMISIVQVGLEMI
jgi:hypothetical protein